MWALILLAFLSGTLVPTQAGINTQLAKVLGHPALAALTSFVVGSLTLFAFTLIFGIRIPGPAQLSQVPGWLWTGGLLGAVYVAAMVLLAPRLGASTMISLVIAGQILASILIDHFGILGFTVHSASPWRIAGALLIIAGVYLIRLF